MDFGDHSVTVVLDFTVDQIPYGNRVRGPDPFHPESTFDFAGKNHAGVGPDMVPGAGGFNNSAGEKHFIHGVKVIIGSLRD
jgi:hypothetical protein